MPATKPTLDEEKDRRDHAKRDWYEQNPKTCVHLMFTPKRLTA